MRIRKVNRGVTLIELVVVVAIAAIVASAAAPGLTHLFEKLQLEGDQSDLLKTLKEAKRIARAESTIVSVALKNNTNAASELVMQSANGANETITLSKSSSFDKEETIVFTAAGTVIPPSKGSMYKLVISSEKNTKQKRYVEVTASGQIAGQFSGYKP